MENTVSAARQLASSVHNAQMYGEVPYIFHLAEVVAFIKAFYQENEFFTKEQAEIVGWLHDGLEDTALKKESIEWQFKSATVTQATIGCSSSMWETLDEWADAVSGMNDRNAFELAVFVKCCDRLANVSNGEKNDKYRENNKYLESLVMEAEYPMTWVVMELIKDKLDV